MTGIFFKFTEVLPSGQDEVREEVNEEEEGGIQYWIEDQEYEEDEEDEGDEEDDEYEEDEEDEGDEEDDDEEEEEEEEE